MVLRRPLGSVKLEAQLREDVQALLAKAADPKSSEAETDQQDAKDEHDLPAEIARREQRLQALAKAKIAERVKERDQQALQDHVDNVARRDAERTESPGNRATSA
ncbi:MAG: hypothetical protein CTY22_12230, partial [Methylomonas sp.]